MLRKLWMISMFLLPALSMAADKPPAMRFFDPIPEQQNANPESAPRISGKDFDILVEDWGHIILGGTHEVRMMNLPADPQLRSEMIQRLILHRAAKRASAVPEGLFTGGMSKLEEDLEWAAKNGLRIQNPQALASLVRALNGMNHEQQLEYALSVPGALGQTLLDGALSASANPESTLRFMIRHPQALSPERRTSLIHHYLREIGYASEQNDPARMNMTVLRQAASLLDYRSPNTICRTIAAGINSNWGNQGLRGDAREHYEIVTRGFVELAKQNVDCRDYRPAQFLIPELEALEQNGFYGRGFFSALIQKLKRGERNQKQSTSTGTQILIPDQKLNQCLIDRVYINEVEVEFNKTEKMSFGQRMLFGALSKGACKLAVDVTKLKNGFHGYIVLDNSAGEPLIKFDQKFETVQEMKDAAIRGVLPDDSPTRNEARKKR